MEIETTRATPAWVDALPEVLRSRGPLELDVWQWLAVPLWLVAALGIGFVLGRGLRLLMLLITRRTTNTFDDLVVERLGTPLSFGIGLAAAYGLLPVWAPPPAVHRGLTEALKVLVVVAVFWTVLRLVDVVAQRITAATWAQRAESRSLVPLASRITKVTVVALGAVTLFAQLGYPVASILAGLGIGGIAVALAAQKTVENLFGAFALGLDQPMRVGDFVRIDDFVGTVEAVGLRSTRVRTLDRTLITMPNSRVADMKIESFAARDRLRLFTTLRLSWGTTAAQVRAVIAGIEGRLKAQPKLWPDVFTVRFVQVGEASLDLEVMAWFSLTDWNEFTLLRQELLLQFLEEIEKAGTSLALPTRTVRLEARREQAEQAEQVTSPRA